ncbi:MAG: DMT family transporter [Candidatus Krumholzibacteriia bacterium]
MGELFSLGCAVIWALAMIMLKKSVDSVSPFALNLYRVTVSSLLFVATLAVMGTAPWGVAPLRDCLILVASGIIGIALSDTLFHVALDRLGAGLTAIVDCLYSPFVVLLAFLWLDERLTALQLAGMVLVIAGLLLASGHAPPPGADRRQLAVGFICGALAMLTVAIGIVIAKPALERTPVIWATAMRQFGALAVLAPVAVISRNRRIHLGVLRPGRAWRHLLPAAVLGSYLALILWIAGMKFTRAGAAAIINQTSTIFVLILAALLLREPFTRRKLAASLLAFGGIALVTIG